LLIKGTKKNNNMKKVLFALFIAAGLTACGGNASTEATTDSTAVVTDSSAVAVDSTSTPVVDSTSAVK
jgi:ABC-type glycerol-3-phosphate transport system substrate-binding protein